MSTLVALASVAALALGPQVPTVSTVVLSPPRQFAVGERAEYDVNWGILHAGTGVLEVAGIDTVRAHGAYHLVFSINGGIPLARVRDTFQSWMDTVRAVSLRFASDQHELSKHRVKHYEIFPERSAFSDGGGADQPSVSHPLDDTSFLFFVRTQHLEVGDTNRYDRYFKPESNPVILRVLRRETVQAAGRSFNTIVVQPIIKSSGIFSDRGQALIWIADDSTRVIVQLKASMAVGSLHMKLKSYRPSAAAGTPPRD